MTNEYPQSSCPCYKCNKKIYNALEKGTPSNISIPYCKTPKLYDCYNGYVFKNKIEPQQKEGTKYINPQIMDQYNNTPGFGKVETNCESCPTYSYLSADPRLTSDVRGIRMPIDRPPMDSTVRLDKIYENKLAKYGQDYDTYKDINAGQIMYYISRDREDVLYEPLFNSKAQTIGTLYKDPMDNMKPNYDRIPIGKQSNPMTTPYCDDNEYSLSWMKDTQDHRQDLLSLQMRGNINQTRWSPRWTNSNI